MATRNIVPRADGEGGLGKDGKQWGQVQTKSLISGTADISGNVNIGGDVQAGNLATSNGRFTGNVTIDGKVESNLDIEGDITSTGTVAAKGSKLLIASIVGQTPNAYRRSSIPVPNRTKITIPKNTQININDNGYITYSDVVLELSSLATADARKGRDVYIYACQPSVVTDIEPVFVLSFNSTVPDGYTAENSRKISGFHCLCAAIGNISGHSLSGYAAGDIIPSSVWDLYWRATSQNEGMSYDDGVGFWVDIYLPSWDGNKLVSVYGGVIVDGYSAKAMHGELFVEEAGRVGKFLIDRAEFMVITRGTPQKTNISGSADPNTTGGHVDTNGVRIVSNSGIEDLCGVIWQWTRDIMGIENANSNAERTTGFLGAAEQTTSAEGDHWRYGLQWQEDGRGTANINIDGSTNVRGLAFGGLVRAIVGGGWDGARHCGGRSAHWRLLSSSRNAFISARCGSMPRVVNAA